MVKRWFIEKHKDQGRLSQVTLTLLTYPALYNRKILLFYGSTSLHWGKLDAAPISSVDFGNIACSKKKNQSPAFTNNSEKVLFTAKQISSLSLMQTFS